MAVRQRKDGRWTVYYRLIDPQGRARRKEEYFGRGAEGEARARKRDSELSFSRRRPLPAKERTGPTFGEIADSYLSIRTFNENSLRCLKWRLRGNILPEIGDTPALALTSKRLAEYVRDRAMNVTAATISRELTDIQAILNFGVRQRPPLIDYNPVAGFSKPPILETYTNPPTHAEIKAILAHASAHLKRAIRLAYYLGLRPGSVELLRLRWEHVFWHDEAVLVLSASKGGPGKRLVPIHEGLMGYLRKWRAEDEAAGMDGPIVHYHRHSVRSLKTAWKGALKKAGITRRLRPYDLRHFWVTKALESGADIKAVSEIVGSSPNTLRRHYQHVTRAVHRETVGRIPELPE